MWSAVAVVLDDSHYEGAAKTIPKYIVGETFMKEIQSGHVATTENNAFAWPFAR